MLKKWIQLEDHTYHISKGVVVHEVKCPVCKHHETYIGDSVPTMCYICEEPRFLSDVCPSGVA